MLPKALRLAALATACAGMGYLAFAVHRAAEFRRRRPEKAGRFPSIVVLKPLHGEDYGLEENLRSFCEQDYPSFSIVFGVDDPNDAAAEIARRTVARFPERARLVTGDGAGASGNPKVANLQRMAAGISGEIVVLADADMRASPEYLQCLSAAFEDERVGAVTCLYAGVPAGGVASELAAMFVNEQFAPSVLVANALEPLRYAFGATIGVRRDLLERVGGFAALRAHVADDHLLGRLVTDAGFEVRLSRYVIRNVMAEEDLQTLWSRELRWSRTIRSVRPLGHAFSFVTFGLPLAIAAAAISPGWTSAILLGATTALRFRLRSEMHAAFGVHPKAASALLVPLRDLLSALEWGAAFRDRGVLWRGQHLDLDPEGEILGG